MEFLQQLEHEVATDHERTRRHNIQIQAESAFQLISTYVHGERKVLHPEKKIYVKTEVQMWVVNVDDLLIWDYEWEHIMEPLNFNTSLFESNFYVRECDNEEEYIVEIYPQIVEFFMMSKNCSTLIQDIEQAVENIVEENHLRFSLNFQVIPVLPYDDEIKEEKE